MLNLKIILIEPSSKQKRQTDWRLRKKSRSEWFSQDINCKKVMCDKKLFFYVNATFFRELLTESYMCADHLYKHRSFHILLDFDTWIVLERGADTVQKKHTCGISWCSTSHCSHSSYIDFSNNFPLIDSAFHILLKENNQSGVLQLMGHHKLTLPSM